MVEKQTVVVARDVIFDERKVWDWNQKSENGQGIEETNPNIEVNNSQPIVSSNRRQSRKGISIGPVPTNGGDEISRESSSKLRTLRTRSMAELMAINPRVLDTCFICSIEPNYFEKAVSIKNGGIRCKKRSI